ncbi:DNA recombination protein RmuC [Microbacterium resistens]|uniref:DNA recombination protein RmuC n=1 Tax=Microbacterium resistens TaxID=156977 RepID=A0ABU1S9V9_9MICO|nr:DNA recombination protein RmuC [Microbacterium resistens]MDR6865597.1 DNA recombination protein RmuC [Microbacterium resistens]
MEAPLVFAIALLALIAGAGAGWVVARSRAAAEVARATAEAAALRDDRDRQYDLYRDAVEHSRTEQRAAAERSQQQNAVLTALAPVRETLHLMQRKVSDLEQDRHAQFGALSEQLRRAHESDEALRATTEALAGALRSTATRGVWGETQLRRVVEAAGLTRHIDFDLQTTISSDNGRGRPDMVIRLAGGASIAVDAKVPLDAYLEASALGATDEARRRTLMQQHVKAVRAHVDALAKKAYWAGLDAGPEFVICFLPSESLLATAIDEDPSLLDHAFGKKIALASPVNLWAVLKTVAYTWTQQEVSAEAQSLLTLGTQLYDRLGVLAHHADDLRRALERTVESYNRFAGSLENRVLVTARRFPGIDPSSLDSPATITEGTRRFTAEELTTEPDLDDSGRITAELGEVRARIAAEAPVDADGAWISTPAGVSLDDVAPRDGDDQPVDRKIDPSEGEEVTRPRERS